MLAGAVSAQPVVLVEEVIRQGAVGRRRAANAAYGGIQILMANPCFGGIRVDALLVVVASGPDAQAVVAGGVVGPEDRIEYR